jgi:RNA polymerase sigma-70 factor (ECF subfamily)
LKYMAHQREHVPYRSGEQQEKGDPASRVELDMPWDDESLVAGLKERNSRAIQFAVETYAPKLYRYAVYQLGEHMAAEDVASETVTRMLEKIDGYRSTGAPFQAWLFSIARNLIRDSYRHRKNTETISLDASMDSSEIQSLGATDGRIDGMADREALVQMMGNLTEEQRQILTLRIIEGWQPHEIADLLGKSIDSVKSLQYRALQSMKRQMVEGE